MESNYLTVDSLAEKLNKLSEYGYGDMRIRCQDGYLHDDEIGFNYSTREILLRGLIYNQPTSEKVKEFYQGVGKLYEQYFGVIE